MCLSQTSLVKGAACSRAACCVVPRLPPDLCTARMGMRTPSWLRAERKEQHPRSEQRARRGSVGITGATYPVEGWVWQGKLKEGEGITKRLQGLTGSSRQGPFREAESKVSTAEQQHQQPSAPTLGCSSAAGQVLPWKRAGAQAPPTATTFTFGFPQTGKALRPRGAKKRFPQHRLGTEQLPPRLSLPPCRRCPARKDAASTTSQVSSSAGEQGLAGPWPAHWESAGDWGCHHEAGWRRAARFCASSSSHHASFFSAESCAGRGAAMCSNTRPQSVTARPTNHSAVHVSPKRSLPRMA